MVRQTIKFIKAAYIIALKYHKQMSEVIRAETRADNIYRELEMDGYTWDRTSQEWTMPMGSTTPTPTPTPAPTPPPAPALQAANIRIMAESERDCADALYYVSEALHACGIHVLRVSDLKPNYSGHGYRVYLDVGV